MTEWEFFVPWTRDKIRDERRRRQRIFEINRRDKRQKVLKDIEVSSQKDGLFSRWKSEGIRLFI